jgi:copper chaperone CopZ
MTNTYQIEGMHCGSCITKVKSELLKLGDVTEAEVQLKGPQATISMAYHIPLSALQRAIDKAGKFTISDMEATGQHEMQIQSEAKGWLATYKPLLLAFAYITGIAILTAWSADGIKWMTWMKNFMGGFFIALSFFKLLELRAFADNYSGYDLLAKKIRVYGLIYPFIELGLGLAYISNWQPFYTNIITIAVVGFSTIGVIETIMNKRKIRCACLGSVFNVPVGTLTLIEDLLMVAMASFSLLMLQ